MKKTTKTIITLMLALVMTLSSMPFASAATTAQISIWSKYDKSVTCTLKNKKKSGSVRIQVVNSKRLHPKKTGRNSVRMTTANKNRIIWQESGAIAFNGIRDFYLGKDNKAYRIYVKTYSGDGSAKFYCAKNVNLTKNKN